jgi:hypothetical protein
MPAWAMGMRIEDIKPSFDVFTLGKLLWSMVSGKPFLRLWYFDEPDFNLEKIFPEDHSMGFANILLKKCIAEKEANCLNDATQLLEEVDEVLSIIDMNADLIDLRVERRCKVCGVGYYKLTVNQNITQTQNFGFNPHGIRSFRIFVCNYCGNVQLFTFDTSKPSSA